MFKLELISFRGGNALIPVMYDGLVIKSNKIKDNQFEENVVIANISLGVLPVEVACGIGFQLFEWKYDFRGSRCCLARSNSYCHFLCVLLSL